MPEFAITFLQINFSCCGRRNRRINRTTSESDTVPNTFSDTASDTLEIDSLSDFELIQPVPSPTLSRAKLRWVRATLAAILRQRVVRAYNQLTKLTKRNKAIGVPDPAVSRLWGQTANWLKNHKL